MVGSEPMWHTLRGSVGTQGRLAGCGIGDPGTWERAKGHFLASPLTQPPLRPLALTPPEHTKQMDIGHS